MQRLWIVITVFALAFSAGADDWKTFYRENRKRLRDKEEAAGAILECATYDSAEAAKVLLPIACRKSVPLGQRAAALSVLRRYKSDEAKKVIADYFKKLTQYDAHSLALATELKVVPAKKLLGLLTSRDDRLLSVALRGIGMMDEVPEGTVDKICRRMKSMEKFRSVQLAGMEALGGISSRLGVATLMDRLGEEYYQYDALAALERLTGQNHGIDVKTWKTWFAENPEFTPVNTSMTEYAAKAAKEAERAKEDKWAKFYGMEITGTNILFVLDHSGSMGSGSTSQSRMDTLKEEFENMANGLAETVSFGILLFPDNDYYPATHVGKANDLFKKRIIRYLRKVEPSGSTPINDAMIYAFEKIVVKRKIDAIYLLSDGYPDGNAEVVRRTIRELNRGQYVKISTLSIGEESPFLEAVAKDNDGQYKAIADGP